jgi:hypothetical protein
MNLFDPTSSPVAREVKLAPRPADLRGLRIGLVENTKFNSATLLVKLADRLRDRHGMTVALMTTKRSPSHEIDEAQIKALRKQADFVVSGIGD